MKIAILGSGAMGSLFGGYLSQENEVWLIDIDKDKIEKIKRDGVIIRENNKDYVTYPNAVSDSSNLGIMDLVVLFVKTMYTESALNNNKHLIDDSTYVMTLQNGAGHDQLISKFLSKDRIIIGTTEHNSSIIDKGHIHHGGGGQTTIGLAEGNSEKLQPIAENFSKCGFNTVVTDKIEKAIWNKLLLNASASVLTAVMQVKLGYILDNKHAWFLAKKLIREAVAVANAKGIDLNPEQAIENIRAVLSGARDGYTSIYADLRDGRKTEVDTISGFIVNLSRQLKVYVPTHEFIIELVHALEKKYKI